MTGTETPIEQSQRTSDAESPSIGTEAPLQGKEGKQKKTYKQVHMPSAEQIMQEDFMNNCAVRTGLSGVMGLGLGTMFGIAMGTFDTAVGLI